MEKEEKKKEILFSVTSTDCEFQATRGSGKGGQKRNKTSNAIHCWHYPSGAHGFSEDGRSQLHNKQTAFGKMARSKEMQTWLKIETARRTGELTQIEEKINKSLAGKETRVETKDELGNWVEENECN